MKKLFLVASVMLLTAGCGIFDGDDGENKTSVYLAEKYFPLKAGSAWTYRQTVTDSTGSNKTVNMITSILGTTRKNNETYTILYDSDKQDSLLVRVQDNVLRSLRRVGATQENLFSDVPLIDFNVPVGESWTIYLKTYSFQGIVVSQDIKGEFLGIEAVQVPAGSITGCLRYRITETISIQSGGTNDATVTQEDIWLAPDAGKVKLSSEFRKNTIPRGVVLEEAVMYTVPK